MNLVLIKALLGRLNLQARLPSRPPLRRVVWAPPPPMRCDCRGNRIGVTGGKITSATGPPLSASRLLLHYDWRCVCRTGCWLAAPSPPHCPIMAWLPPRASTTQVTTAKDGVEGLAALTDEAAWAAGPPFWLALIDLHMPNLDGCEMARRYRAWRATPPFNYQP